MRRNRRRATAVLGIGLTVIVVVGILWIPEHPQSLIFRDELHYGQAARDLAAGMPPKYNRHFAPLPPPLYGAALVPAHWIGGDFDGFAWWSRVVNVVLYASILIPAYRLARIGAGRAVSVAAAYLALLTSAVIYMPFLMAENLVVPLVLWCGVAAVACARRPNARRAFGAGAILGLAGLTKTLALGLLPAMLFTAVGRRAFRWSGVRQSLALIAGTALVVIPWRYRTMVFGADTSGPILFDYADEIAYAAAQPVAKYAYWGYVHLGAAVVAVTPLIAALAVVGAIGLLRGTADDRRALGRWCLAAAGTFIAIAGFFVTNIAWWKPIVHERYLVPLWPLAMIAAVVGLARPATGRAIAIGGVAAVGLIVLTMPLATFASGNPVHYDYPSGSSDTLALGFGIADGPARWIGLAILALAPFALWRPRTAGVIVLIAVGGFHVHRTVDLLDWTLEHQRHQRPQSRRIVEWLRERVRPQDVLIQQSREDGRGYRVALALEMDMLESDSMLQPNVYAPFRFEPCTGKLTFPKTGPGGRVLLLARLRWLRPGRVIDRFGNDLLYDLTDGVRAALPSKPTMVGIDARGRVGPRAKIVIPLPKPGRYRIVLSLRSREEEPRAVELHTSRMSKPQRMLAAPDRDAQWSVECMLHGWAARLEIRVLGAKTKAPLQVTGFAITPLDQ